MTCCLFKNILFLHKKHLDLTQVLLGDDPVRHTDILSVLKLILLRKFCPCRDRSCQFQHPICLSRCIIQHSSQHFPIIDCVQSHCCTVDPKYHGPVLGIWIITCSFQRIHCASDPDSLDGVIFLDKRAAIVDATAPHVMEPDAPGAEEQVVSLYHTLDADALHAHADEVKRLFAQNTALRSRAARYIASAGSLLLDSRRAEACSANFEKVRRYVKRLCARTLPRLPEGASASEELRLLSAITPKGPVFYRGTVQALADRYVVFHDDYGAVSRLLLELIRAEALARGYHIITCPCAMHPDDKIDHLFIPALRLAFLTDNRWHPVQLPGVQAVRCTRFVDRENLAGYRARLRFNERAAAELLEQAADLMAQAKACHDELETYYRAAVDFGKVDEAAARCAELFGLEAPSPNC